MKSLAAMLLSALFLLAIASATTFAQTFAPTPNQAASQAVQLQELTKKIEEQNAKIDMLSQQILKLQVEMTHQRPGVMIGESAPSSSSTSTSTSTATSTSPPASSSSVSAGNGNGH